MTNIRLGGYLLDDPRVRHDYGDWNVVLASGAGGVAYLPPALHEQLGDDGDASPMTDAISFTDFQGAPRLDLVPLPTSEMRELSVEPVFGIEGRGGGQLMFERGEAAIDYQISSS
ncbi:MAG: hypothetical protein AAFQ09_12980 [Pseudomonadota bacterium]